MKCSVKNREKPWCARKSRSGRSSVSSSRSSCVAARWKRSDLGQHRQVARPRQVPQGGEQPAEPPRPRILQAAGVAAHRHRHVGVAGGHAEFVEHPAQRRVGAVVVHQERAVDGDDLAVPAVDVVGVCVTAEPGIRLEQRDPVPLGQFVGGGQTRHAAPDDGDRTASGGHFVHIPNSARLRQRMGDAPQNGGGMLWASLMARSALMRYSRSLARVRFWCAACGAGRGRPDDGAVGQLRSVKPGQNVLIKFW